MRKRVKNCYCQGGVVISFACICVIGVFWLGDEKKMLNFVKQKSRRMLKIFYHSTWLSYTNFSPSKTTPTPLLPLNRQSTSLKPSPAFPLFLRPDLTLRDRKTRARIYLARSSLFLPLSAPRLQEKYKSREREVSQNAILRYRDINENISAGGVYWPAIDAVGNIAMPGR